MEEASKLLATIELDEFTVTELQNGWETTEKRLGGPKEAGEHVFAKMKDALPKTEPMLKRSSTVWHLLDELMRCLGDPAMVQRKLEYIALRHMNAPISPNDVEIFKNVLFDVTASKLGGLMTPEFQFGLGQVITAVGTSLANTHEHYAARLKLILSSWALVQKPQDEEEEEKNEAAEVAVEEAGNVKENGAVSPNNGEARRSGENNATMEKGDRERHSKWGGNNDLNVPKAFTDMARFNASVMGIGDRMWFADLVYGMESLAPNIGNIDRVQEECDVLALTLARYDKVNLAEFRSVLFATLRCLLPSTWSMDHEDAWSWMWGYVEKKVLATRELPIRHHGCLKAFMSRLDEESMGDFKLAVFETFFASTEESQLYLRAANARLQYIMGRILTIMADIYTKTHAAVIAISALGLMHAGHGVPEDLVRPFVAACMQAMKNYCPDEGLHEGLWWTLDLIGRIFIRTLSEGSTAVIIAINKNTTKELQNAISRAPRGKRQQVLLTVQVGTESISPLMWAVDKGAIESAGAILRDLLTIRADRSRYYYGMEAIWSRHPDIIPLLCNKAPSLLTTVLDGLMWRSKNVKQGMRRVNHYISSMLLGPDEGELTDSLLHMIRHGNPEIICHPSAVFQADLLWSRLCLLPWVLTKLWFCVTLVVFIIAEQNGILGTDVNGPSRTVVILCRAFLYLFSLGQLFAKHLVQSVRAYRSHQTSRCLGRLSVPSYLLQSRQEMTELVLMLLLCCMLCIEPALHCLSVSSEFLIDCCEYSDWHCNLGKIYSRFAAFPMILYFMLASELVNLNVQLSIFSVICATLWWEFLLYLFVLAFFALAFSSAIACLPQSGAASAVQMRDFFNVGAAFESVLAMSVNTYAGDAYAEIEEASEPMLKWLIKAFAACWHVYLMNLMVAQLCQRCNEIYHDARGNARLTRGIIIYETSMPLVSKRRWNRFVQSLNLEEACELDEGDNGPRGAVPTVEPPYEYIQYPDVELDRVKRFGGLANAELPWPEIDAVFDDSAVARMDRMVRSKFEEMDRLMVDMAVKLGVRPPGTGTGTGFSSAGHSSLHGSRQGSKIEEKTEVAGETREVDLDDLEDPESDEENQNVPEEQTMQSTEEATELTEEVEIVREGTTMTAVSKEQSPSGTSPPPPLTFQRPASRKPSIGSVL